MPPRRPAVLYARVSSREQRDEGYSIEAQVRLLRDYASKEKLEVLREFVDVETAKKTGRTHFSQLLELLGTSDPKPVLLVEKTDRLYRNLKDWVAIDDEEPEIHFVREGVVLAPGAHSSERFLHGIKVLMARQYVENLSEEVRKGMAEKARSGVWPSCAPVGYKNQAGPDGRPIIVPNPETADAVRLLFQGCTEGLGLTQLEHLARDLGLRGLRGGALSRSSIQLMLRNPIYFGDFRWAGELIEGAHEPLIPRHVWDEAQMALSGRLRGRRPKRGASPRQLELAGLVRCAHCGHALVGSWKKGGQYVYYRCSGGAASKPCEREYVREEELQRQFAEAFGRLCWPEQVAERMRELMHDTVASQRELRAATLAQLQKRDTTLEKRIDAALDARLDGELPPDEYLRRTTEWREARRSIAAQLTEMQDAEADFAELGAEIMELCAQGVERYARYEDPLFRRRWVELTTWNSKWGEGKLAVEFAEPFSFLEVPAEVREQEDEALAADVQSGGPYWT